MNLPTMKILNLLPIAAGAAAVAFTLPRSPTGSVSGTVRLETALVEEGGKVVLEGAKPEVKPLTVDAPKFPDCGTIDTTNQTLIVGPNGGIANVVVTVEVAGAEVKAPEKAVQLDQKSCRFEPHVVVVPAGTTVEFLNSDKGNHNIHTYSEKNEGFNKTITPGNKESLKLSKAETVTVKCDIHPWMESYVVVADSNFTAVTGPDGSFKIDGLPAGEHKVTYWHETLGKQKGTLKVAEGGKIEPVEVKMSAEKKKPKR
jgi:plastocyanin